MTTNIDRLEDIRKMFVEEFGAFDNALVIVICEATKRHRKNLYVSAANFVGSEKSSEKVSISTIRNRIWSLSMTGYFEDTNMPGLARQYEPTAKLNSFIERLENLQ